MQRKPFLFIAALIGLVSACDQAKQPTGTTPEPPPAPLPFGVYEFRVTGIGGSNPSLSVEQLDMNGRPLTSSSGANLDLTKFGGLFISPHSVSTFLDGPGRSVQRYITMTYQVRNASGSPRNNVTFIAYSGTSSIEGTPFTFVKKFDGNPASFAFASRIVPTGTTGTGEGLQLISPFPDALQVFTEAEVAAIPPPADAETVFPYGFTVRNVNDPSTRTLPVATDVNDFDGVVTFAFRLPLSNEPENDVFSLAFKMIGVEDTEVRLTESIEEAQDTGAVRRLRARAASLGATTVTVLNGSSAMAPSIVDYPGQRQICSVRTAGTAAAPTTFITTPGTYTHLAVLNPGESLDSCAAYFRTGTPSRPAPNVPYTVTLKAVDRYGNLKNTEVDTVHLEVGAGSAPAVLSGPIALVGGSATRNVTYSNYGSSLLYAVGRRKRGERLLDIFGVTRVWSAGAGTTDWSNGANWQFGAAPMTQDSVQIPTTPTGGGGVIFPQLVSNVTIRGIEVGDTPALIALGPFDLTAFANVQTGTGSITNTTGRLFLAGTAMTIGSTIGAANGPVLRVTGTYSLTSNVSARAPLQVDAGRITASTYRLQASSY
jgi:hypothetical protein